MSDVIQLVNNFAAHKNKLNIFINLHKNDKIMEDRYHKVLYAEPPGYLQFWKRWWYGENKNKTFHHLDIYFTNFMKFLDKIIKKTDMNLSIEMTKLSNDICDYINQIIPGIYSLKDTYPFYKKLHCKVDSIILTLIDFKGEVRKKTKSQSIKYPPSLII